MPHGARNAAKKTVAAMLVCAFITSQSPMVKGFAAWNAKTMNTASTRSESR
jgi:hypothetical protein